MSRRNAPRLRTLLIIAGLIGLFSGATAGAFVGLTRDLPQIRELENFEPSAITRIYSADQVLLAELFLEKRTPVSIDRMPDNLKAALIVTEDRKFYRHSGIDVKGIVRAIIKDILAGQFVEGASTITQQLAKTLFLTPEKTLTRKIKEAILAFQLERRYTKDELLALYLNQIYFGSGAYGVESAARRYFGIRASDMDLAQCALLAGLPKAPSRYSPLVNPELATRRRNLVLTIMRNQGIIDAEQHREATAQPVLNPDRTDGPSRESAPYFIRHIQTELEAAIGPSLLYKGGLTVHTTLSHGLQQAAEEALAQGLDRLTQRMPAPNPSSPQGALVALDLATGGIVAMVGGDPRTPSYFNRATDALRQPGSAFKPVVYALAIARGFTQASLVLDAPVAFAGSQPGEQWRPENYSQGYQGEMTLRQALSRSKNTPAVRLAERLGPSALVQFAHKLGIASPLEANLAITLGSTETTLLELTAAYAVFPQGGNHIAPFGVTEIVGRDGVALWRARPTVRPVVTPPQAAVMVDMLEAVVKEGTGRRARGVNMPLAGKTGTTNDFKDALFVGFSPAVAAGVWVGMDDHASLGAGETGARAALPIWTDFMAATGKKGEANYFAIPDGMRKLYMDPDSGRRLPADAPGAVRALFIDGSEPAP